MDPISSWVTFILVVFVIPILITGAIALLNRYLDTH